MKKTIVFAIPTILAMVFLVLAGCGGDDGPSNPPSETCAITVTGPAAGAEYLSGEDVSITWTERGDAAQVVIDLLKAGEQVGTISTTANDGYKGWEATTMGALSGPDFAIRVAAVGEEDCSGTSAQFQILNIADCSFGFTIDFDPDDDPETPFELLEGQEFEITWDSENTTGFVDIALMRQDGVVGYVGSGLQDTGSYVWTVDSFHQGTYPFYYFRISDRTVEGCQTESDMFPIIDENVCEIWIDTPQAGTVWERGASVNIAFTAPYLDTSAVNINLYQGSVFVNNIANSVEVTHDLQQVPWTVDTTGSSSPSTEYRIKISDAQDQYCVAWSESFTIPGE
jgi:predicted small lipoprotein YifL